MAYVCVFRDKMAEFNGSVSYIWYSTICHKLRFLKPQFVTYGGSTVIMSLYLPNAFNVRSCHHSDFIFIAGVVY